MATRGDRRDSVEASLRHIGRELQAGRLDAALAATDELIEHEPRTAAAWAYRGRILRLSGEVAASAESLRRATRLDPSDPYSRRQLAWVLWVQGKQSQAKATLRRLARRCPDDYWAPAYLAQQHLVTRQFRAAERAIERAVVLAPDSAYVMRIHAGILANLGAEDRALELLDRLLAANPNDLDALGDRGRLLAHLGRYPEAQRDISRVVRVRPNREYFHDRALIRVALGRWRDALADCRRLLQVSPKEPNVLRRAAQLAWRRGALDDARQDLLGARQLVPGDAAVARDLATAEAHAGDLPAAERRLNAMIRRHGDNADLRRARGAVRLLSGRGRAAERDFKQAIAIEPSRIDHWLGAVWGLYRAGASRAADRYFEAARGVIGSELARWRSSRHSPHLPDASGIRAALLPTPSDAIEPSERPAVGIMTPLDRPLP